MTLTTFKEQLKTGLPAGIYLLGGREDYLKEHTVHSAVESLLGETGAVLDLLEADYSAIPPLELTDFAQTLPAFSSHKILLLSLMDDTLPRKELTEALLSLGKEFPPYLIVLFNQQFTDPKAPEKVFTELEKALPEHVQSIRIDEQEPRLLARWLTKHAESAGKRFAPGALDHLLSVCDCTMLSLRGEMSKLCAYPGEEITVKSIDALTVPTMDAQIYELADSILAQDAARCMAVTDNLLEKFPEQMVVASVYNAFFRLYKIALWQEKGLEKDQIAKKTGLKTGSLNKNLRILRSVSLQKTRKLIGCCMDLDQSLKRFSREKRKTMDLTFLKMMEICRNH